MLNTTCVWVDDIAYRPAVLKLTRALPTWWHCQLAHLSMRLDDRWGTGYWDSEGAPAAPDGLCEACGRRAAYFVVGGSEEHPGEAPVDGLDYLDANEVQICGWCQPVFPEPPRTKEGVERALVEAGERSIAWRWRWRPR
jgi:hypothetical protein